jgi:hypothetical protein
VPESIYFATSPQYPGMVKIGRTDRPVEERLQELSSSDYGPVGETGDSVWHAAEVIVVDDNVSAEAALHQHFADSRVSDERELFYSDDPEAMAEESLTVVDGQFLIDVADPDVAMEILNTVVEYGLIFGGGAIVGRLVHKKLVGNPKYEATLRQAAMYSEEAKSEISRLSKHAQQQWDESKPKRREIVEGAKYHAEQKWNATEAHRAELAANAKNISEELRKKSMPVLNRLKSKVDDIAARRSKKK